MQCDQAALNIFDTWQRLSHSVTDAELDTAKNSLITQLLRKYSGKLIHTLTFWHLFRSIYSSIYC